MKYIFITLCYVLIQLKKNNNKVIYNAVILGVEVGIGFHLFLGGLFERSAFISGFPDGDIHHV